LIILIHLKEGKLIEKKTIVDRKGLRNTTKKRTRRIAYDFRYEKGKALKIFLNNITTIMFDNTSEN